MTPLLYRTKILNDLLRLSRSSLQFRPFSAHVEAYNRYKGILPFTEKEKILINNTIIGLLGDSSWTGALAQKGIPAFFVKNNEFRSSLIEYLDRSNEVRSFVRDHIGSLVSYNTQSEFESDAVPSHLIRYICSFVVDNMPSLLVACHNVKHLADFRTFENEWTKNTERRKVFLHVGPPNSGKTHASIKRLSEAPSGIYCSPLRLLAWEMCNRLNGAGVACSLLTGQENVDKNGKHLACTVEMAPLEKSYDVAVLDEMQMVGDPTRGYAWTKAFLHLKAPELHLCGSHSCLNLARKLADIRGDLLHLNEHARLGPIKILEKAVGLEDLEPGDCVVCFSRNEAFALRDQIEANSYHWAPRDSKIGAASISRAPITSVVYGALPPETRCSQIDKFNARETKVLVASDVIGMGVNVAIKRVIFHRLAKYDGTVSRQLNAAEVQQIAGRAGRYGLECGQGEVSCTRSKDLYLLRELMAEEPDQIERAVIAPNPEVLEAFSVALNQATGARHSLSDVTQLIASMARTGKSFAMCDFTHLNSVAKSLEGISLPSEVYKQYLMAPTGSTLTSLVLRAFAASHALLNSVKIANVINSKSLELDFEHLDKLAVSSEIKRLELLYEALDTYTWLANRFPAVYVDSGAVLEFKGKVASLLSRILSETQEPGAEERSDACLAREIVRPEFIISE